MRVIMQSVGIRHSSSLDVARSRRHKEQQRQAGNNCSNEQQEPAPAIPSKQGHRSQGTSATDGITNKFTNKQYETNGTAPVPCDEKKEMKHGRKRCRHERATMPATALRLRSYMIVVVGVVVVALVASTGTNAVAAAGFVQPVVVVVVVSSTTTKTWGEGVGVVRRRRAGERARATNRGERGSGSGFFFASSLNSFAATSGRRRSPTTPRSGTTGTTDTRMFSSSPSSSSERKPTTTTTTTTPAISTTSDDGDDEATTERKSSQLLKFKNVEEMLASFRDEPVLLTFTAANCGPCHLQKHELVAFRTMLLGGGGGEATDDGNTDKKSAGNRVQHQLRQLPKMVKIDIEKWPQIGNRFDVSKLPCVVFVKENRVLLRLEGLTKAEVLAERIRAYL